MTEEDFDHASGYASGVTIERDELISRLRGALGTAPHLRLAVLFGSRARGSARAESDVDVAIVPERDLLLAEELRLASSLSGAVGLEVDVVRLDHADPLLAREVATSGVALFEWRPGAFAAFRADAISAWLDFEETIAPHRAKFLARLAGGGR